MGRTTLNFSCARCGLTDIPVKPPPIDEGMTAAHLVDRVRRVIRHYHAVMNLMCAGEPLDLKFVISFSPADEAKVVNWNSAAFKETGVTFL